MRKEQDGMNGQDGSSGQDGRNGPGERFGDEALLWQEASRRQAADYRIFQVAESVRRAPGDREGRFYLVDAPDWITVVPVTVNDAGEPCFLIVRQYRHGSGEITMEFPAGMVDPGESPEATAGRELLEETGCRAGRIRKIGDINPNPAFMTNQSHTFLAEDLVWEGEQALDAHEMVHVFLEPVERVIRQMGRPPYHSAIMVQACFWYLRESGRIP